VKSCACPVVSCRFPTSSALPCVLQLFFPLRLCVFGGWVASMRRWTMLEPNYDHVGNAILGLFILTSGEDWPDYMFNACDITGVNRSLKRDANQYAAYYFVLFVAVSNFFLLSLVRECWVALHTPAQPCRSLLSSAPLSCVMYRAPTS
jgi:hypothetical protein